MDYVTEQSNEYYIHIMKEFLSLYGFYSEIFLWINRLIINTF